MAVIGSIWMLASIGVGEGIQVIIDPADPNNPLDANTTMAYGGQIDFVDRVATAGVLVTVLGAGGLGLLVASKNNPPFINTTIKYSSVIIGLIAFTAFSEQTFSLLQGDRVWSDYTDGANSYILFLTASFVSGLVSLLKTK